MGLLIGQSSLNQGVGPVIFLVPDRYLINLAGHRPLERTACVTFFLPFPGYDALISVGCTQLGVEHWLKQTQIEHLKPRDGAPEAISRCCEQRG